MNEQYGTADFIAISKDRRIEERKIGCLVPTQTGIDGTGMIASFGLVIVVIILHELRRVVGRFRVHHGAGISTGPIVFRALGTQLTAHLIASVCIVIGIIIAVCRTAADVVHRGSHRCLDACVIGSRIDGKSAPTADTYYADTFGIHVRTCRKVIHRSREIFGVDVWRSHVTRLSAAFARERWIESNRQESPFGKCLSIQPR